MSEIWKDVVGYEGIYQVSSLGRVKRMAGGPGAVAERILRPGRSSSGYLTVSLYRDGKSKSMLVHRLVAERFLGPAPSPKYQINHRNGDKADNRVENLEWVTGSENRKHAFRVLGQEATVAPLQGEANGNSRLTRREVKEIRRLYATGKHGQRELGRMFGVTCCTICYIVNRRTWKHV